MRRASGQPGSHRFSSRRSADVRRAGDDEKKRKKRKEGREERVSSARVEPPWRVVAVISFLGR